MPQILWVDDDSDDFPAVHRAITGNGFQPVTLYSIADAVEWLKAEPEPAALVLDAIVPLGGFTPNHHDSPQQKALERYTGFLILEEFPGLASRTIILSVVPENNLRGAGLLRQNLRFFSKLDLGLHLKEFRESLPKVGR